MCSLKREGESNFGKENVLKRLVFLKFRLRESRFLNRFTYFWNFWGDFRFFRRFFGIMVKLLIYFKVFFELMN